jgi:hypothetical protein
MSALRINSGTAKSNSQRRESYSVGAKHGAQLGPSSDKPALSPVGPMGSHRGYAHLVTTPIQDGSASTSVSGKPASFCIQGDQGDNEIVFSQHIAWLRTSTQSIELE